MSTYNLLSFESNGVQRAGIHVNDRVYAVADLTGTDSDDTVIGILKDWRASEARIEAAAGCVSGGVAPGAKLEDTQLLQPIPYPVTVYCAGANYRDHNEEMAALGGTSPGQNMRAPGLMPWHFIRPASSMAGPGTVVPIPFGCQKFDWEVELAAVIGHSARNVAIE